MRNQKTPTPPQTPPEDPSDMTKFEFEMSRPAGNVNELELIQVMEDSDDVKQGTIKIEDDPDSLTLEPPSSKSCCSFFIQTPCKI